MSTEPFTIRLSRIATETDEEYAKRCLDVANYARSKTTQVKIDHFTRVSEHSYQIMTPGYQSAEKQASDRDTHFAGAAALQVRELRGHIINICDARAMGIDPAMDFLQIEQLLARRAYDLVFFVLKEAEEHDLFADDFYGRFSLDTEAKVREIPDLTEWPKQGG